jgi:periplasmic protein CpxP/Spy
MNTRIALLLSLPLLPLAAQQASTPAPQMQEVAKQRREAIAQRMVDKLQLSQSQQDQIKAIREKHGDALKSQRESLKQAHEALKQATQDPKVDQTQLHELYVKASEQRFKSLMAHRAMRQEIDAILTPEQREKAKTMRASFMEHRKERMKHSML